jgi:hypothetical protein
MPGGEASGSRRRRRDLAGRHVAGLEYFKTTPDLIATNNRDPNIYKYPPNMDRD